MYEKLSKKISGGGRCETLCDAGHGLEKISSRADLFVFPYSLLDRREQRKDRADISKM